MGGCRLLAAMRLGESSRHVTHVCAHRMLMRLLVPTVAIRVCVCVIIMPIAR